ncbi:methyl-accepting chemotaxis protein [Rhizobium helianthi]|uniref:Methyl-accepting chemotaxis protein n=1 Tax=Rhizobium helianthi TaxID=1132695 RepID=A0ABW4M8D9_9HYPH
MRWFNDLKLSSKLLFTPIIFLVCFGVISTIAYGTISMMRAAIDELNGTHVAALESMAVTRSALAEVQIKLYELITTSLSESDTAKIESKQAETMAQLQAFQPRFASLDLSKLNDQKIASMQAKILAGAKEYLTVATSTADMVSVDAAAAGIIMADVARQHEVLVKDLVALGAMVAESRKQAIVTINDRADSGLAIFFATIAIVSVISVGLNVIIARLLAKPLARTVDQMTQLADGNLELSVSGAERRDEIGAIARAVDVFKQSMVRNREIARQEAALEQQATDLRHGIADVVNAGVAGDFSRRITKRYDREDLDGFADNVNRLVASVEIGVSETQRVIHALSSGDLTQSMQGQYQGAFADLQKNVNQTIGTLARVLGQVSERAMSIDGGTVELSRAAEDLSKRTEVQAASLEQTSAAVDEITAAVRMSSERAQESSRLMSETRSSATSSTHIVDNATAAMARIEQASSEIGQIINVIDSIAFQTNLLALNAGVEAARAGEAGKGFAVVAQEVRDLAQRSAAAAKDIKNLVNRSTTEVSEGVTLVNSTGEALRQIEAQVVGVADHINSIASAAREQSIGLSEVSSAVGQMDHVTQQNASMVEQTAAGTTRLAHETAQLMDLLKAFKLPPRQASTYAQAA